MVCRLIATRGYLERRMSEAAFSSTNEAYLATTIGDLAAALKTNRTLFQNNRASPGVFESGVKCSQHDLTRRQSCPEDFSTSTTFSALDVVLVLPFTILVNPPTKISLTHSVLDKLLRLSFMRPLVALTNCFSSRDRTVESRDLFSPATS